MSVRQPIRSLARRLVSSPTRSPYNQSFLQQSRCLSLLPNSSSSKQSSRAFSVSTTRRAGIMPHAEEPAPRNAEPTHHIKGPTPLEDDEYHEISDKYMEQIVSKMEEIQESREDVEVEYSAGVLSILFPPNGSYVINKQPPNKQIWLSSPITGPKRYDWVVIGESMHQKEGGGVGDWMYIRDGSSMTELLKDELGISVSHDEEIGIVDPAGNAFKEGEKTE